MCQRISRNLRPGGRFLTYQLNPDISREPGHYLRYGADLRFDRDFAFGDGDEFSFCIDVPGFRSPEIAIYYWSRAALDSALRTAGFGQVRWMMPELSPEASLQPELWQDYLEQPLCVLIECVKD
jgi:hypothetical protein